MSYHIYNTKGLVLSERSLREADRVYSILTRDLGLVRATALGVRKESSKLRGSLEPFSLSKLSLVRGKEYWRLTSAELIQNVQNTPATARAISLLEKLVQGESAHPELFDTIEYELTTNMIYHISGSEDKDKEGMFEINLVAQILFHLGYLKESDLSLDKKALIKTINLGLEHSQLV